MNTLYRFFFRISKPIHKYLGLVLCLYFLAMGASGLLLNNPGWIRSMSVSWNLTPANYEYQNWNRMLVRQGFIDSDDTWFVAGKAGVLRGEDGAFTALEQGFPRALYERDTSALLPLDGGLLAATRGGLYAFDRSQQSWRQLELPGAGRSPHVVDVVRAGQQIVAFTARQVFVAEADELSFRPVELTVADENFRGRVPLFRILHDIHNGTIIGLPGKLLVDVVGLALVFLSISCLVIWYVPRRNRWFARWRRNPGVFFRFNWRYHLKVGVYAVAFLAVLAISGALLRPPLLIAIAPYSMEREHPLLSFSERSHGLGGKIQRALYSTWDNSILLATESGFWRGPADFSAPFRPASVPISIHGMGATVLEEMEPGLFLVGSFSGLFVWEELSQRVWRLPRPGLRGGNPFMSNDLVSGVILQEGYPRFRLDYHDGMLPLSAQRADIPPAMPREIARNTPLSLWHYLFEFHNGRIFEKWLGTSYMLVVPIGGVLLLIIGLSGLYDWWYRRRKAKQKKRMESAQTEE